MRIFTLLKQIILRIGLISDYIVEQGTTTISDTTWTYEKRASGFCKLIGTRTNSFGTGEWKGFGSWYYAEISDRNYPFALTELIDVEIYAKSYVGTPWGMVRGNNASNSGSYPTLTNTGTGCSYRPNKPSTNAPIKVIYEVTGKWK